MGDTKKQLIENCLLCVRWRNKRSSHVVMARLDRRYGTTVAYYRQHKGEMQPTVGYGTSHQHIGAVAWTNARWDDRINQTPSR